MEYKVNLLWDEEAGVWVATSEDVPGLVLESGSVDALMEKVRYAVPDLLEISESSRVFPIHFFAEKYAEARA